MTEEEQPKQAKTDDHVVFIGSKPFKMSQFCAGHWSLNYVTGVVMQFTTQGANEVVIKGRGKFITRSVDVAEVASKRFLQGQIEVKDVKLNSEEFKNKEGRDVRVSTIEVTLTKTK